MLPIIMLGTRYGSAAGFTAALGVAVGLSVHTAAVVLGLAALLKYVPVYVFLRRAGAAYLVYLAISAWPPVASATCCAGRDSPGHSTWAAARSLPAWPWT